MAKTGTPATPDVRASARVNGRTQPSPDVAGAAPSVSDDAPTDDSPLEVGAEVRYAFQLPRTTLRAIKQLALDRDQTASDLVRGWVEQGLAGGFDHERVPVNALTGPISQFPVTMSPATRAALQQRSSEEGLRVAQLVRRWVAHGLWEGRAEREQASN